MKPARKKDKSAAVVTIKDAGKMTKKGRREVAAWLRKTAETLTKYGDELAPTFRARYIYR